MCALPFCDKTFARRDNLLQHERKHKDYQAYFNCAADSDFQGVKMPHVQLPEPEMTFDPAKGPWWEQIEPLPNPFAAFREIEERQRASNTDILGLSGSGVSSLSAVLVVCSFHRDSCVGAY